MDDFVPADAGLPAVSNTVRGDASGAVVQAASVSGGVHVHSAGPEQPVPRQLLAAPPHFVGRDEELARLDRGETGRTVVISALAGAGGIGKTALALHWAQHNLERFPDGQLFVDLQGFSPAGDPVDPAVAVRGFLDAFGVVPDRIPADLAAQAALYRSLVAGRRMLIVLDNAADATQVIPLLPGSPSCTVLVTSRRRLTSVITRHGAHHLPIGVLTEADARQLLIARVGADRVSAEPAAVDELLACCGGFALALNIIAARAAMNPVIPLRTLAAELRDPAAFDDEEPTVSLSTVLSWSLRMLTQEQTQAFALLGIAPGVDISLPAAANLIGLSAARARQALRALEEASLLMVDADARYSMHDLIRDYAARMADQLPNDTREAALWRVVDFYLHSAYAADRLHYPYRAPITLTSPTSGTHPQVLPNASAALAWFDTEHANVLAVQQTAATHDWHQAVWQLAWTLVCFHNYQLHRHERLAVWQVALAHADHLPDPTTHILIHRNIGRAYGEVQRYDEAIEHLHQALALAERHDDLNVQASVYGSLAWVWEYQGKFRRALVYAARGLYISRRLGDTLNQGNALNTMSWCAVQLGDFAAAREHSSLALTLHRRHGHQHGEAFALRTLGYADQHTGHYDQAVRHYEQAIALFRGIGYTGATAYALNSLGQSYAAIGELNRAREAWREAVELYRRCGDPRADHIVRQLNDLG